MSLPRASDLSDALHIAIVGPGRSVTAEVAELAAKVGQLVARAGCVVITGGGDGVMAVAARGATEVGGTVVGLLAGDRRETGVGPLTVAIPTGLGELRNGLVVRSADVVIAVGGSWGTTSEIALAMRTGVPVVCLAGWRFADADGNPVEVVYAATPEEAVAAATALAGREPT